MFERFYYGVCYYPEHWPVSRHASDFQRMKEAGFDVVRMGEGAWGYWEPAEGKFQFDLFDQAIDLACQHGIKVILGTPTYCAPAWVSATYPEVLRWDFQRQPMAHGSRRNFNYTSPKYLELSDRICTALAEHYKSNDQVIGWQLDNEFNCQMDVSYAPTDTIAFRRWLREKYKSLDHLNEAWGTKFWSQQYSDWEQIDLPHPTTAYLNPSVLLDETRFISDCVMRFAHRQAEILRKHNKRWQITHNGLFPNVNGPDLARELDFFSQDQYPLFAGDWTGQADGLVLARSLSFPFAIMEQQSGPGGQMQYFQRTPLPGEPRLWAWQSIAHGAAFLSYFRWRTCPYGSEQHWHGLLDYDNKDTRRLAEAKLTGEEFRKLPREFFAAKPRKTVGILRDFDNETNERRINTYAKSGANEFARWLAAFSRMHVPADYVWADTEFDEYLLLIVPHQKIVTTKLAKKLTSFVKAGGTIVLGAQAGVKDINCHMVEKTAPGLLAELAGIEVEDWTSLSPDQHRRARDINGNDFDLGTFVERLRCTDAMPLAHWTGGDALLGNSPAITWNQYGAGSVMYIGGYCDANAIAKAIDLLRETVELEPMIGAGSEVEVIVRETAKRIFVIAMNHSAGLQRVSGLVDGKEILTGEKISSGELVLEAFGVGVVEIPLK
jgi:beta-galactosidase